MKVNVIQDVEDCRLTMRLMKSSLKTNGVTPGYLIPFLSQPLSVGTFLRQVFGLQHAPPVLTLYLKRTEEENNLDVNVTHAVKSFEREPFTFRKAAHPESLKKESLR